MVVESVCTFVTPYISSLAIDYGIQQNGIVIGAPLDLSPYAYRAISRVLDGPDKKIFENSYSKVNANDIEHLKADGGIYYEINPFGVLNGAKLEDVCIPVFAFAGSVENISDYIALIGDDDESKITSDYIDRIKKNILEYSQTHNVKEMYKSAVEEKVVMNEYLGLNKVSLQIKFVT